jgi:hypothetical protein
MISGDNDFRFSATFRIHGVMLPIDEISRTIGVEPTHVHRQGEIRRPGSTAYSDDAWHYSANLECTSPFGDHIDALWAVLKHHADYIRVLKQHYRVDVFCGYRTSSDQGGFEVPSQSLDLYTTLGIPFGVSVIVA